MREADSRPGVARRERRPTPVKERALGLLAVRWRSREELRRRLRQAGYEAQEVEDALHELDRTGLIDDARFAREVVRDQVNRRLAGDRAIRLALREKGIDQDVIDVAIGDLGDEVERAAALAERRVTRLAGLSVEAAYRRLHGLLLRRGYPPGVAREAARRAVAGAFPHSDVGDPE
ncbi:MAG TPA: regulatory protein RecX [Actinomycetota bacterium]|nr:regulatory protein RecX [Actinomycetota bacterium]